MSPSAPPDSRPRRRVLGARELGRAMLARQLLLRRVALPVTEAVERLGGLNAQEPNLPYLALWARLEPFAIEDLTRAIEERSVVRSTMMRATQHVVSVPDFRSIRPLLAPLLRRVQRNAFGRRTAGVDPDALVARARRELAGGRVLTRTELGRRLAPAWPGVEPAALGWSVQYLEPVIHPAPSGTWNVHGPTPFAAADWTGMPAEPSPDDARRLVRRYLAAFGPASAADARAWSGLGGLREVFDALRSELRVYADESGRELFDLPDAPLPDPGTPAPVRFLPAFDAPLLAYADRTRVMSDDIRRRVCVGAGVEPTVLVDGVVAATWSAPRGGGDGPGGPARATLAVRPFRPLTPAERAAVEAEGDRLLAFARPAAAARTVRIED